MPQRWKPDPAWLSITCAKHKTYTDRFGWPRVHDPRQAKATNICNLTIRYLQHLLANIVFGRNDSQNVCRKRELFLLWCALFGTHVDIGAFILRHLTEAAKTTHENVKSVGLLLLLLLNRWVIIINSIPPSRIFWGESSILPPLLTCLS